MKRLSIFIAAFLLPLIAGASGTIFPYFNTEQDQRFPLTMTNATNKTQAPQVTGSDPHFVMRESDQSASSQYWNMRGTGGSLCWIAGDSSNTNYGFGFCIGRDQYIQGYPSAANVGWHGDAIQPNYGGTGFTSYALGDTIYSSATNALSKLSGNTTTTKKFLTQTGNGTISAAPGWNTIVAGDIPSLGANPSASIGLTAVNGSASTYLRSDGAPALDVSIAPTWSGQHIWSQPLRGGNGSASAPTFSYSGDTNNGDYLIGTDNVGTATAGALRMSITSAGQFIVGSSNTAIATSGVVPAFQVVGTSASASSLVYGRFSNDSTGAGGLKIVKSRGTSVGTFSPVVLDDGIGGFNFQADDGTDVTTTAVVIDTFVDGAVSTGVVPGRMRIRTTNSAGSTQDAVTFNSSQQSLFASGTAALPSISLGSSPTTGLYRKASNDLGISIAGTLAWNINSTGVTAVGSSTAASYIPTGSTVPTNGVYLPAANTVGLAANTTQVLSSTSTLLTHPIATTFTAAGSLSSPPIRVNNARPTLVFTETGVSADAGQWAFDVDSEVFNLKTLNDANNASKILLSATRSGNALSALTLGNSTDNNTYSFPSSGTATFGGTVTSTNTLSFVGGLVGTSTSARLALVEGDQTTDENRWDMFANAKALSLRTRTDADGAGVNVFSATRGTGTAITDVSIGNATNNPTYSFLGTGTATFSGQATALRFVPTSSTAATNGLYLSASNTPAISSNSTLAMSWDSSQDTLAAGNVKVTTAGKGLYIKEGSNAKMGTCTLSSGACVVSTTAVAATSRVFITIQSLGTVAAPKAVGITARTAGTSFTITSADGTDTSVIAWMIVDPS